MINHIKCVGLNLQSEDWLDEGNYLSAVSNCIDNTITRDSHSINLVKVHFDADISVDKVCRILENISDTFKAYEIENCIFIPIGGRVGVKDITIDKIEVEQL